MKYLFSLSLVVVLALPSIALAEQVRVSCTDIADATERLACFDRTFPGASSITEAPTPTKDLQTQTVVPEPAVVAPVAPVTPAAKVREGPLASQPKREVFSSKEKIKISSRLKSVRDMDKQKMIFLLENDQIWMQDSPRSLPFVKGQDVVIKSGTIGGYLLSNEDGVSTRVRQIK